MELKGQFQILDYRVFTIECESSKFYIGAIKFNIMESTLPPLQSGL